MHAWQRELKCLHRKELKLAEWAWFPSACSLETFNAHKLAQKLAGRYVLLVGDSLMVQQFAALQALMHPAISTEVDPHPDWEHFYSRRCVAKC